MPISTIWDLVFNRQSYTSSGLGEKDLDMEDTKYEAKKICIFNNNFSIYRQTHMNDH